MVKVASLDESRILLIVVFGELSPTSSANWCEEQLNDSDDNCLLESLRKGFDSARKAVQVGRRVLREVAVVGSESKELIGNPNRAVPIHS
jgi:hypothetical protein